MPRTTLILAVVALLLAGGWFFTSRRDRVLHAQLEKDLISARAAQATLETKLQSADDERSTLQRRLVNAEARPAPEGGSASRLPPGPPPARGDPVNVAANPSFQKLVALQQRNALDARYAALFKKLQLAPAELEKLKSLLMDKQNVPMDVMNAAIAAGLNPRDNSADYSNLMRTSQAEVEAAIQSALGEAGFADYRQFEQTQVQRALAGQLAQRLSYTDSPLTDAQTEALIRILAETAPANASGPATTVAVRQGINVGGPAGTTAVATSFAINSSSAITDAAIQRAAGLLTPTQLQALTSLQQQQQTEAQLINEMRKQVPAPAPGAGPAVRDVILPAVNLPFTPRG